MKNKIALFTFVFLFAFASTKAQTIEKPTYNEGNDELFSLIVKNVYLKAPNLQALRVEFYVDAKGNAKNFKAIDKREKKDKRYKYEQKAEKYIKTLKKWKPGTIDGVPTAMYDTITILYGVAEPELHLYSDVVNANALSKEEYEAIKVRMRDRNNKIYNKAIDKEPLFPGGKIALSKYIYEQIQFPADAPKRGGVVVSFYIETDGSVGRAKIVRSLSPSCDQEALRIINSMPKWTPGVLRGKVSDLYMTQYINFRQYKK